VSRAFTSVLILLVLVLTTACEREKRQTVSAPLAALATGTLQSEISPGAALNAPAPRTPYQGNAYAMSEGKRLYTWFNCVGCHAHGGGGMGPPLMDARWIYGSAPQNIYSTIVEGRPNGMPAFRDKIPEQQVWQLAAYVRSLSGLAPSDAAPGRSDEMHVNRPESITTPETPVREGVVHP
jgi:cytochrome c oxidase cbb3-type subunit 3